MNRRTIAVVLLSCCFILAAHVLQGQKTGDDAQIRKGMQTFRFDTFGDQAWWGDTLHLHEAIEGVKFGGIGPGISPATALSLGLKVDLDALPPALVQQLKKGKVDLNDPAVTLACCNSTQWWA